MSIHGNQNLLPLFVRKDENLPSIGENSELTLAFHILTKDLSESEKVLSFSRLLWPFLSVPGVISTHIFLDGLFLFSKKGKFTNPPRQPVIGHILRNVENRSQEEQLKRIIDVLTYKDSEAEEIGDSEESEYQTLKIDSLVNPENAECLIKLFSLMEIKPISDYMPLDTALSTEKALDISEQYRNMLETMKGNGLRWQTLKELIEKEVNKWLTDITVELKDVDSRYSSQLSKTSSRIDTDQARKRIEQEHDKIEIWKDGEKRKIVENIAVLFKTAERNLEELLKKNKFFSNYDTLKTKLIEDIFASSTAQFEFLENGVSTFIENLQALKQKFNDLEDQASRLESEAAEKLAEFEAKLNIKLQDRDKELTEVEQEKTNTIAELEASKNRLEELVRAIDEILQNKKINCLREAEELKKWSVNDDQSEFFSKPIQWFYLPLYAMFIEDEDMMDERMSAVIPTYIADNIDSLFEDVSEAFTNLKTTLIERVDEDMKIRSNFEFSCENKNLLEDPNIKKKLMKGISTLKDLSLINDEIERNVRKNLSIFP